MLYSGRNRFVSAGVITTPGPAWPIQVDLLRAAASGGLPGESRRLIDPAELHETLRCRLLKLADEHMPPHERVPGLSVDYHIVSTGVVAADSPLVDVSRKLPYSQLCEEGAADIIRKPRDGLRCYQRVSAGLDAVVSAFIEISMVGDVCVVNRTMTVLPPVSGQSQPIGTPANSRARLSCPRHGHGQRQRGPGHPTGRQKRSPPSRRRPGNRWRARHRSQRSAPSLS